MLRVYLETTIPSYLSAWTSRDVVILARQEMTREWWEHHRHKHDVYISEAVVDEASSGDKDAAEKRIKAIEGIPVLSASDDVVLVTNHLINEGLVPTKAFQDAVHIAMATVYQMDVLLTWNCTHLANAAILGKVNRALRQFGYEPPIICTPEEMLGEV